SPAGNTWSKSQLDGSAVYEWITNGQTISFAYTSNVDTSPASGKRYHLSSSSDTSPYTVNGAAHTITGTYVTQYKVTSTQTGIGSDATPGATLVSGTDIGSPAITVADLGTSGADRWFTAGGTVSSFAYSSPISSSTSGLQYMKTSGPSPASIS